ncbi:hypothetical protein GX51_01329 [Blastomyces parvus]|uniref:Uncharacterized protein n=1 Tax=Blastomyces parvus TaxID=2060905 RepID=A0A2B7XGX4_9EURO|nr:hypothetical protein GX51_01329 [Blastomyces parvus]
MYGFPIGESGCKKLGYRGTKYTHPKVQRGGQVRSSPITKWTSPSINGVSTLSIRMLRRFLDTYMPELHEHGIVFKFLPVIGRFVADVVEGNKASQDILKTWQWRKPDPLQSPVNILMEGTDSSRALQNVEMQDEAEPIQLSYNL